MTHRPTRARALALAVLALALLLANAAHAVNAQKRNAPEKKSAAQSKSPEAAKPGASKSQQTTTQTNGQTPTARQLEPSILVRWQGRPGINRYRLQLATDEKFEEGVFDQARG